MRKTLFLFAIAVSILLIGTSVQADTSLKDRITTFFELSNFDLGIGWSNYIGSNEGTSLRNTGPSIFARYGNLWGLGVSYEEAERIDGGQHGHNVRFIDIGLDRKFAFVDDQLIVTVGGGWSHPIVEELEASDESLAYWMGMTYLGNILADTYFYGEGNWWPEYRLEMNDTFFIKLGLDINLAKDAWFFDRIDLGLNLSYRVYRTSIVGYDGDGHCWKWGGNTDGSKASLEAKFAF